MWSSHYSRRDFLRILGGAAAVITVSGGCGGDEAPAVEVGDRGLLIDGRWTPLFSGGVEYWSYSPELWPELLDRLSRLGINTIGVPAPWDVHEVAAGEFDFGRTDPRRDLDAFLRLVRQSGFKALLRLGPFLPGGATGCGVPARLIYDRRVAARTALGTLEMRSTYDGQYPAPSLFSDIMLEALEQWCVRLAGRVEDHLATAGGPVAALLLESPLSYFGLLDKPYTIDYHPSALDLYRTRLAGQYLDIAELNRTYQTAYQSFDQVEPPREFVAERVDNLPAYLDWTAFRLWADNQVLDRVEHILRRSGLDGVPLIRRGPSRGAPEEPAGQQRTRRTIVDPAPGGHDSRAGVNGLREAARTRSAASGYSFRSGTGGGVRFPAAEGIAAPSDREFALLYAIMYGLKGWDSDVAVEKDGWLAAPVTRDGEVREDYFNACRRICRLARESRINEFSRLVDLVLLDNRALRELRTAATEDRLPGGMPAPRPAGDVLAGLGLETPVQAAELWRSQVEGLLADVGFDWDRASAVDAAALAGRYRVALLPALDLIYTGDLPALRDFVAAGGALVFGPGLPRLNERIETEPAARALFAGAAGPGADDDSEDSPGEGRVIRLEAPLEVGDLLKELEVGLPFTRTNRGVELALHQHPSGRMLLFAANSSDRPQRTDIFFQGRFGFRDLVERSTFDGEGKIRTELRPRSVVVWEVSR